MSASSRPRLSRDAWTAAALDALATRGLAGIAVEPLALKLGVTKGSFYAHFNSRDELLEAALSAWESSHGTASFAQLDDISEPAGRLGALLSTAIAFSQSDTPSIHVQLLRETHDPRVRAAVDRVTHERLQWLTDTYAELGLSRPRAEHRARIAYATFLGLLETGRDTPDQRLSRTGQQDLADELRQTLIEPA